MTNVIDTLSKGLDFGQNLIFDIGRLANKNTRQSMGEDERSQFAQSVALRALGVLGAAVILGAAATVVALGVSAIVAGGAIGAVAGMAIAVTAVALAALGLIACHDLVKIGQNIRPNTLQKSTDSNPANGLKSKATNFLKKAKTAVNAGIGFEPVCGEDAVADTLIAKRIYTALNQFSNPHRS